ncbi:DUF72 domain-containing protein [Dactylosporangium darangshiense]|uniref:DUF72 domain-containing protein n=1 Tax=Dactylosporangium darangshiense TaxID=579108 RepID=A0ABP8D9E0_9ACTN
MGVVRVGTASWANRRQLASGWYPRSVRTPAGRLAHYASRFDLVEADTGHYAIPAPEITAAWAAATPPGFTFDVKAFGLLTGHPTSLAALPADLRPAGADLTTPLRRGDLPIEAVEELWLRLHQALDPLEDAGRLGAVLLSFPGWLAYGPAARRRVLDTIERCAPRPPAVELRHPSWFEGARAAETLLMLHDAGAALVCVSDVHGLAVTAEPAIVRLEDPAKPEHGAGERDERPDEPRLADWAARLRHLAADADELHLLVDTRNAHRDAERLVELLAERPLRSGLRAV